jgi:hypothetical protein
VLPVRRLQNTAVHRAALLLQRARCIPIPALFIRISRAATDTFSLLLQKFNATSAAERLRMFRMFVALSIRRLQNTAVHRAAPLLQRARCIPIPALFTRISRAATDTFSLLLQKFNAISAAGGDSEQSWPLSRAIPRFLKLCTPLALCFSALRFVPLVRCVWISINKDGASAISAITPARASACIAALLVVSRMAWCLLFWPVQLGSFKIAMQAGQCVIIRFDTRGKKLDVDAFLSQLEDAQEPRFVQESKPETCLLLGLLTVVSKQVYFFRGNGGLCCRCACRFAACTA